MKFCHLSAAVRASVRWKVRENRQACFPRTITANFMTVFADMFPADLWFAKAAFILLSLCWAATTISRRQQCLFWQVPLSFLAPQMQQASPQKPLYEFMGLKQNFYIEKHNSMPKQPLEVPAPATIAALTLTDLQQRLSQVSSTLTLPLFPWWCWGCAASPALWELCWAHILWLWTIKPFWLPLFYLLCKSTLFSAGVSSFSTISSMWHAVIK